MTLRANQMLLKKEQISAILVRTFVHWKAIGDAAVELTDVTENYSDFWDYVSYFEMKVQFS